MSKTSLVIIAVLMAALFCITFTNSPRGAEEKASAVHQWEYHQIIAPRAEDELNKLGGEGWEMCGVLPFKDGGAMIYFKRSKTEAAEAKLIPGTQNPFLRPTDQRTEAK